MASDLHLNRATNLDTYDMMTLTAISPRILTKALAALVCLAFAASSHAALISVSGPNSSKGVAPAIIVPGPGNVEDDEAKNKGMQGFDEKQGVRLLDDLAVDGGSFISARTTVDSHMIFLNSPRRKKITHRNVIWEFSGKILGVMSDNDGMLEANSSELLGLTGTIYPDSFNNRGFERFDRYEIIDDNKLRVRMRVTEPGDWIRVVTRVPDASTTAALLALGVGSIAAFRRFGRKG